MAASVIIMLAIMEPIRFVEAQTTVLPLINGPRSELLVALWRNEPDNNVANDSGLIVTPLLTSSDDNQIYDEQHQTSAKRTNLSSIQANAGSEQQQNQQEANNDTEPPYMQHMTQILVILHFSVFISGLVGNALVCLSVYRNKSLQTVTNYYIVNLAVADFLVILICLPPTVYWDLTLTWNFGLVLCKLVLYLQSISVSVSVLTLTCISMDRWYAICRPLEFCSTKYRAKVTIALIWLISMLFTSPDLIYLTTKPLYVEDNFTYMDCTYSWPENNTKMYQLFIVVLLFIGPFVLMSISYWHIVNVLWRNETVADTLQHSVQLEEEQQFYLRQMNSPDSSYIRSAASSQQAGGSQRPPQVLPEKQSASLNQNWPDSDEQPNCVSSDAKHVDALDRTSRPTEANVAGALTDFDRRAAGSRGKLSSAPGAGEAPVPSGNQQRVRRGDSGARQTSLDLRPQLDTAACLACFQRPLESEGREESSSRMGGQQEAKKSLSSPGCADGKRRLSSHLEAANEADLAAQVASARHFELGEASRHCPIESDKRRQPSRADLDPPGGQFPGNQWPSGLNNGADLDKLATSGEKEEEEVEEEVEEDTPTLWQAKRERKSSACPPLPTLQVGGNCAPPSCPTTILSVAKSRESSSTSASFLEQSRQVASSSHLDSGAAEERQKEPSGQSDCGAPRGIATSEQEQTSLGSDSVTAPRARLTAPRAKVQPTKAKVLQIDNQRTHSSGLAATIKPVNGACGAIRRDFTAPKPLSSYTSESSSSSPRQAAARLNGKPSGQQQQQEQLTRIEPSATPTVTASSATNGANDDDRRGTYACFRCCLEANLVRPLKRQNGQSVAGTYKTSKKYRQNLANYAAQRDKYRQKQGEISALSKRSGSAMLAARLAPTASVSALSVASNKSGGSTSANSGNAAMITSLVSQSSGGATTLGTKAQPANRSRHTVQLPAATHLKPNTVQNQNRQSRKQPANQIAGYSVGQRRAASLLNEQPNANGSLQANQEQQQQQQQQSTNNNHNPHWSHTRFCKLIESRKKAAKMLIVIVIMFGLCYLPVHFLNTLRYTVGLPQNDITLIASLVSHWLCYFNSAVNPLIYNLMSGKFRHEFANLFFCKCFQRRTFRGTV